MARDYISNCLTAECLACDGEGEVAHPFLSTFVSSHAESPPDPVMVECEDCNGTGWIECDWGGVNCRFKGHCYCEAAWDRQQEANASEPPETAQERHQRARDERNG